MQGKFHFTTLSKTGACDEHPRIMCACRWIRIVDLNACTLFL